jgi:KaiC/GvpD/RAD55 family RecA-like ATPase
MFPDQQVDAPHHHTVQFYGDDNSLFTTVSAFLADGLVTRQPGIVIATEEHREAIVAHLCGRLIDCDEAVRKGDLILLDADEMLALFMVGDSPDPDLFDANIGRFIEQLLQGRHDVVIRAYGEMVDVLWKRGEDDAAIKLEILWNKLAMKYRFALLCGYAMGSFYKQTQKLERICAQHSHVIMPDAKVRSIESGRARHA